MTSHPTSWRTALALAVSVVSLSFLAACGDDDDEAASVSTKACDAAVELTTAFGQAPEDPAEFSGFATDTLVPLANTLHDELDGDAGDAAEVLADAYQQVAADGDISVIESEPVATAQAAVGAAIHDGCDLQRVEIGAVEYSYQNAPDTLKAGRASFALQNKGVEEHEMVLFRRADGETASFEELSQLPEDQLFSKLAFTGVAFGKPGTTSYAMLDLEPGTYFLVCFIPQGGAEDGPPHFMAGMQHTLTVT
ncbi:MAG: hypothetical protein HZB15_08365 [Actinobacteria bacterium]|nr:hypothetical protein [Actinomycetota bacterium]